MSPYRLRRFRAERLLRQQFSSMRSRVLAAARARLRARGITLDESDLEACYAQAWQGLYSLLLEGSQIANLTGWLTVVTFRRAVEEHRSSSRAVRLLALDVAGAHPAASRLSAEVGGEYDAGDLARTLDDRHRLRQLFEALRLRLSERELQAAALCYLQGLARAEAAQAMGISERRLRRLMEGCGPGRPGVAAKVGALAETIRDGAWCDEQGSLMRGLAFGILDPAGERYRFALAHSDGCPACRAYVASLRGLAAVLPPLPALAHLGLAAGALGEAARHLAGSPAAAGHGGGAACGASGAAPSQLAGAGGLLPASGGAAGGGWLLAGGGAGVKLAAGCALALGVGAGCVTLGGQPASHGRPHHHGRVREDAAVAVTRAPNGAGRSARRELRTVPPASAVRVAEAAQRIDAGARTSREFGLEGGGSPEAAKAGSPEGEPSPRAARASRDLAARAAARSIAPAPDRQTLAAGSVAPRTSSATSSAQREFTPG
jgi:DNA-directed RNA polymerase specialized sigma24 family protein